jgi:hypothetical protein
LKDETKELFERSLAILIRREGPDGSNTAISNIIFGRYYYELVRKEPTVDIKRKYILVLILEQKYMVLLIQVLLRLHTYCLAS